MNRGRTQPVSFGYRLYGDKAYGHIGLVHREPHAMKDKMERPFRAQRQRVGVCKTSGTVVSNCHAFGFCFEAFSLLSLIKLCYSHDGKRVSLIHLGWLLCVWIEIGLTRKFIRNVLFGDCVPCAVIHVPSARMRSHACNLFSRRAEHVFESLSLSLSLSLFAGHPALSQVHNLNNTDTHHLRREPRQQCRIYIHIHTHPRTQYHIEFPGSQAA